METIPWIAYAVVESMAKFVALGGKWQKLDLLIPRIFPSIRSRS